MRVKRAGGGRFIFQVHGVLLRRSYGAFCKTHPTYFFIVVKSRAGITVRMAKLFLILSSDWLSRSTLVPILARP